MRQPSAIPGGGSRFSDGGPIRGIRVRALDSDPEVDTLIPLAVVMAGLVGVMMGIVGANPALVIGWLS
ncbi:MAG TPA: hypothetical protein VIR16_08775 [Candidatus Limnocylindrales bacterium]